MSLVKLIGPRVIYSKDWFEGNDVYFLDMMKLWANYHLAFATDYPLTLSLKDFRLAFRFRFEDNLFVDVWTNQLIPALNEAGWKVEIIESDPLFISIRPPL